MSASALRVAVVDDEPLARERIRRLLEREPNVQVVGECASGAEAVTTILSAAPDAVFLDVQMPGMTGFDVVRELGRHFEQRGAAAAPLPLVVFVTAHNDYAMQAFEVHAIDYVPKPLEAQRLAGAIERLRARRSQADAARRLSELNRLLQHSAQPEPMPAGDQIAAATPSRGEGRALTRIVVKEQETLVFLRVEEIDWIEAAGNYVRLHVAGRSHVIRDTLSRLEQHLDAGTFLRIHRSTIVNIDSVRHMEPWFSGEYLVLLNDGTQLKLSRSYRERVFARLLAPDNSPQARCDTVDPM